MAHVAFTVNLLAILSGFALTLGIGVYALQLKHRILTRYFRTYVCYVLFQALSFISHYLDVVLSPLPDNFGILLYTALFAVVCEFTISIFRMTVDILKFRPNTPVRLLPYLIRGIFFLFYTVSFLGTNVETIHLVMQRNLWSFANITFLIVYHACLLSLFLRRNTIENALVRKMVCAYLIFYLINTPSVILENVIYNYTSWRLFDDQLKLYTCFFLLWNVISFVILFNAIRPKMIQPREASGVPVADLERLGITRREMEIVRDLLSGKSAADIGEGLFISPRTVEKHISNIYRKTGQSNRNDLAAFIAKLNG